MMYRYRICMNNGEIFNVSNDEPIDLDAIAKARWMEIQIPYAKGKSKKAYLNNILPLLYFLNLRPL